MKKVCLLLLLFVFGCNVVVEEIPSDTPPTLPGGVVEPEPTPDLVEKASEVHPRELTTCTANSECTPDLCIDNLCGKLENIYPSVVNCAKRCNYNSVTLSTSDGEIKTVSRGSGSYTYAGALEWKVRSLPDYCEGQEPKVALYLLKKNYGDIEAEAIVTVGIGQTTSVITHPSIPRVQFTTTIQSIEEVCS
jgi:hypothetical protein